LLPAITIGVCYLCRALADAQHRVGIFVTPLRLRTAALQPPAGRRKAARLALAVASRGGARWRRRFHTLALLACRNPHACTAAASDCPRHQNGAAAHRCTASFTAAGGRRHGVPTAARLTSQAARAGTSPPACKECCDAHCTRYELPLRANFGGRHHILRCLWGSPCFVVV